MTDMLEQPLIELSDVSCKLGGKQILNSISLALRPGEIVAVLGPSGAGKSTLLRVIAGFEQVSEGRIERRGELLSEPGKTVPPENRGIGIVTQSYALFPHMTALQNVKFGINRKAANKVDQAREWLEKVAMQDRAQAYPHELSGGEQQRVALARALAREPELVLLDEAFSSLDQQLRHSVRRETRRLLKAQGKPAIAVTHDPEEAMDLADRIVILNEGEILQQGRTDELFWRPVDKVAARLLGEINEVAGTVEDGSLITGFGRIECSGMQPGQPAMVLARPAALSFQPCEDGPARIASTHLRQGLSHLVVEGQNGAQVTIVSNDPIVPSAGTLGAVRFDRDRIAVLTTLD